MTITASKFKAHCLKLLEKVNDEREEITVTKHGKPVAKVSHVKKEKERPIFGYMAGKGRILGDIMSPIDVEWEAMK